MFDKLPFTKIINILVISSSVAGCGTVVPQVSEAWEGRDVNNQMAYSIKRKIFCELATAIKNTNDTNAYVPPGSKTALPALPDNYGVQMETILTIEENSSLNPSVALNRTLPNGFAAGVTNIGQSYSVGFGGTASATATRTDTAYSYYLVGRIGHGQEDSYCGRKDPLFNGDLSSPLIKSDLGIQDFLISNTLPNAVLHSSSIGKSKSAKLDVFTYDIKFMVVTNGSINPTWKLVPVSGGGSNPLLGAGRSRTHNLILTFGPNAEKGFEPALVSLNQNLAANIRSATQNLRSTIRQDQ